MKKKDEGEKNAKWMQAYVCVSVRLLFKAGQRFGHHLEGERKRDRRGERVYKAAAAGDVKNRQLHRQKQDAESIHF